MNVRLVVALWCLLAAGSASAQTDDDTAQPAPPAPQEDELRGMQAQRAELLRELQKLREELAASEARIAESQERIRQLESQQLQ